MGVSLTTLGITLERNPLSVFSDADGVRRINPLGRVPALRLDDGEVLIDSAAILDHLDERVGAAHALIPPTGPERRRVMRLIALATGCVDKAIGIVYDVNRQRRPSDKVHEPWLARSREQLSSALLALEAEAPDTAHWFHGEQLGQADITIACTIGYTELRAREIGDLPPTPHLHAHSKRCEGRAEFIACLPGLDDGRSQAKELLDRVRGA